MPTVTNIEDAREQLEGTPEHLSLPARYLWKTIRDDYDLGDEAAQAILTAAFEAWDRAKRARERLKEDGEYINDRFGQVVVHPAVKVEREARNQFLSAIKQLGLDIEPLRSGPGRPPGHLGTQEFNFDLDL
ncbi:P27 family phage terminase small subunit [Halomonas cupida]|uniref:P27 family phage terminase small subunit n=1 Tax=Halomonas cupida TaxID=44933 RepID=UPI0039B6458C